jgi:hypothetical protein
MPFLEVMLSFLGERLLLGSSVGYFGMVLFACSFLSFLCEKRVGSSFSFERGRREVVVLGGVCLACVNGGTRVVEIRMSQSDRTDLLKFFQLIVSMSQSDR